jgi:hypothetical protein
MPRGAQQAPVGAQGLGVQFVPAPRQTLTPAHSTWAVTVQEPAGVQQAPVATQGLGVQVLPPPCQALAAGHPAWVVRVQVPAGAQQAPIDGQGLGVQLVPALSHVLPLTHACSAVTVQVPAAVQQAPVGMQGLGVQLVPVPCQALPAAHAAWVVTAQVPVVAQQAPDGCVHGLGEQMVLLPPYAPAAAEQLLDVCTWQEPLMKQHAPSGVGFVPSSLEQDVKDAIRSARVRIASEVLPKCRVTANSLIILPPFREIPSTSAAITSWVELYRFRCP